MLTSHESIRRRFAAVVLWSSARRGLAAGRWLVVTDRGLVAVGRGLVAAGPGCRVVEVDRCCGSVADEDENKEERYRRLLDEHSYLVLSSNFHRFATQQPLNPPCPHRKTPTSDLRLASRFTNSLFLIPEIYSHRTHLPLTSQLPPFFFKTRVLVLLSQVATLMRFSC
ncbi:hypothetical protein RIF29_15420 [Crotalaria pallida]|uniref:Uncharacterized protein n=1 Tax=Crotalaria pallida TaxID=3830 RepID=A0AAN9FJ24_CROPI